MKNWLGFLIFLAQVIHHHSIPAVLITLFFVWHFNDLVLPAVRHLQVVLKKPSPGR